MTIRKTCQWFVILVLLLGGAGGTYGVLLWNQSSELLRTAILAGIAEAVPDLKIHIQSVRPDWMTRRHLHLYDVEIQASDGSGRVVFIPEIVLTIDGDRFEQKQEIDVSHVRLRSPAIDLIRDADGKWNWERLPKLPRSDKSLPEIEIEEGIVRVQMEQIDGSTPVVITLQQAGVDLIPSGKREFRVRGSTQIQQAGVLHFDAEWNVDAKTWNATGKIHDVTTSGELTALVASTSPQLRSQLQRVDATLRRLSHQPQSDDAADTEASYVPDFGIGGTLDLDFRVSRLQNDVEPKFALSVDVHQGHVTNAALPFPLHDMAGRIVWDNDRLEVQQLLARYGVTRVAIDGHVERRPDATPAHFDLTLTDVVLDDKLRERMPEGWQRIYDSLHPGGNLDAHVVFDYDGKESLVYKDLLVTAKNCTARPAKFQYPVRNVAGTIKQEDWGLQIDFTGLAGRRPVTVKGKVINPGAAAEAQFDVVVNDLPLDETFVGSCTPQQQKTIRSLGLRGVASGQVSIHKPAGIGKKYETKIAAKVWDGSLEFDHFRWAVEQLTGKVTFDSTTELWTFKDLEGHHDSAVVLGDGTFSHPVPGDRGLLTLNIQAKRANIDDDLLRALPKTYHAIWAKLSPTGRLDLQTSISWVPQTQFVITFPSAKVYDGTLNLEPFPLPLANVKADLSYADGRVDISSFSANKGRGNRVEFAKGYTRWNPQGDWWIQFDDLHADDLNPEPNSDLRRAFKERSALRNVVDRLNPQGPISCSGGLQFHGTISRPDVVTAAWSLKFTLNRNSLNVGVDLKNVSGMVKAQGTVDDQGLVLMSEKGNYIDLEHAEVMGLALSQIRGPYQLNQRQLTVGSKAVFAPQPRQGQPQPIPAGERLTAKAVGGELTLDVKATLQDVPTFGMRITLSRGNLDEFSRQFLSRASNLRGDMDGWIDLGGRGMSREGLIGKGQLRITNASLYELPVFVKIFNVIKFSPPENTAFKYAMADFEVKDQQFNLSKIDLDGDTIRLLGSGTVRFDGLIDLKFATRPSRQTRSLVDFVVGEATRGWMGVDVTGHASSPIAKVQAVPQLGNAVKELLRAFDLSPRGGMPGPPPTFLPFQLNVPGAPADARRETYR